MAALTSKASAIIGGVVALVVLLSIVAATLPDMFTSVADVNGALNDANNTTGDASADSIKTVFPILIGVTFLLGIVGAITAAVKFKRG